MQSVRTKNSLLAVAIYLGAFAGAIFSPTGSFAGKKLELKALKDRVYRLESGPINRCPEKIGFQLNPAASELLLYPMEAEWEKIRTHVSPVVIVRGLKQDLDPSPDSVVQHANGKAKSMYAAVLEKDSIESVTLTRFEESMLIETHAKMEFLRGRMNLTRWSVSGGNPLSEMLLCSYREAPAVQTALNLAQ